MADDLSRFCCLNPDCPKYGQRDAGNLTVGARYGTHHRRLLYCRACKDRFSERKGTPLFDSRLADDVALNVLAHLADGCGVRQTGRLVGSPRTRPPGTRPALADMPANSMTSWSGFPPHDYRQVDEKWSYIGKKEKNCDPDRPADRLKGDCWDHVALDADSRLVVEVVVGPRTADMATNSWTG
ncbi:hypothetical protein FRUB_04315 [Fimbriiglobus ruber]|uniref:Uncharacterized protein n=1 Tax=Fimbriiglobus ruber TaxID=1908690 RepID=A0A225E1J0_9BACT|nr:hypothetical protein FRUB_04315 [Fimbriiglobus ruber]